MQPLILVGFMGAGKTTVGTQLAAQLKIPQFDLDQLIEASLGETIATYFSRMGEEKFRQVETTLLKTHLADEGVLSTGGGVVMKEANRQLLKQAKAPVIYLRTQPEELLERLQNDLQRPLLQQMDHDAFIELWQYREKLYQEVADVVIETDGKQPDEIATTILKEIG